MQTMKQNQDKLTEHVLFYIDADEKIQAETYNQVQVKLGTSENQHNKEFTNQESEKREGQDELHMNLDEHHTWLTI